MKFLGWILFLAFSSKVYSQNTVIEPAPLSVEDDGTRKILNKKKR